MKKRVVVGMSGGVDSSVAAFLLKEQGYDVIGVFMRNWEADQDDPHCTAEQDLMDARLVADRLGIPLKTVNFAQEYWDRVFQYFLDEYAAGRTPNPDILCNKEIKFKAFLDYALELGADFIATGHYAKISQSETGTELLKARDANKDQSYFLHAVSQQALAKSLFPLGDLEKPEVRKIARQLGLSNSEKKDSTGICFIGERKFRDFLSEYMLGKPGIIETTEQEKIGQHQGLIFYTLGQRQGLGIGGQKNKSEDPWYVVKKDLARNVLIVAQKHDHPLLYRKELTCNHIDWINPQKISQSFRCQAKTRYRQPQQDCEIIALERGYLVKFEQAQWAITPGQSVVFYQDEICLGGGIINDYQ